MLSLLKPKDLSFEDVKDFRYASVSSILMPASKILIGTAGRIEDAVLYESSDVTFDFTNGTGDNGLDVGTESTSQWYALYAVPKTGTFQYILKASVNLPHVAGGSGPVGFTKYRYLGLFRNGVNGWSTTANHLPGDICYFAKTKNIMAFQGFNDANAGQYPLAIRHTGIALYMANTATNGFVFDFNNAANIGMTGNNAFGGAKVPFRDALFSLTHFINVSTGTCMVILTDSSANDRRYIPMTLETSANAFHHHFDMVPSQFNWQGAVRSFHSANSNVNRGLLLTRFNDPYTVGGI